MENQPYSMRSSHSHNYRQWSLDDDDEMETHGSFPRSPPSRPPPTRSTTSSNRSPLSGTSWLGHSSEEQQTTSHCNEANQHAWDYTNEFNTVYYNTGLWDGGCLNPPYCLDSMAQAPIRENSPPPLSPSQSPENLEANISTQQEHEVIEGENKFSHYTGKLETCYYNNGDATIYYLKLQDIINYVSRGCSITDEHLDNLIEYITSNVDIENWVSETRYTVAGNVYRKSMLAIKNHQYIIVAKYCLEWMIANPEKVSMPEM